MIQLVQATEESEVCKRPSGVFHVLAFMAPLNTRGFRILDLQESNLRKTFPHRRENIRSFPCLTTLYPPKKKNCIMVPPILLSPGWRSDDRHCSEVRHWKVGGIGWRRASGAPVFSWPFPTKRYIYTMFYHHLVYFHLFEWINWESWKIQMHTRGRV